MISKNLPAKAGRFYFYCWGSLALCTCRLVLTVFSAVSVEASSSWFINRPSSPVWIVVDDLEVAKRLMSAPAGMSLPNHDVLLGR